MKRLAKGNDKMEPQVNAPIPALSMAITADNSHSCVSWYPRNEAIRPLAGELNFIEIGLIPARFTEHTSREHSATVAKV